MAYNPQEHTLSNFPYAPAQPVPTDARSYYKDNVLQIYRPYKDVAEVIATLPTVVNRTGHFPIFIHSGALQPDGKFLGGEVKEYWFKNGVTNAHLVEKQTGSPGGGGTFQKIARFRVGQPGAPMVDG